MRFRKRLAFGLRTYSNLTARRARALTDNRHFDAILGGVEEFYSIGKRVRKLVQKMEDQVEELHYQAAMQALDEYERDVVMESDEGEIRTWENERGCPF